MSIGYGRERHGTQELDWTKTIRADLATGTYDNTVSPADALKYFSGNKIVVHMRVRVLVRARARALARARARAGACVCVVRMREMVCH